MTNENSAIKSVLLIGSAIGDHYWALHVNRYSAALRMLGLDVEADGFQNVRAARVDPRSYFSRSWDLLVLQDTHLDVEMAQKLKRNAKYLVLLTHSEMIQGKRDKLYIDHIRPDYVFTDQPIGEKVFDDVGVPVKWMGHGADHAAFSLPWKDKTYDVLWVGHRKPERAPDVDREVKPLLGSKYSIGMFGRGYIDGPLNPSQMFVVMARSKIVIHIGNTVTDDGGYSGTRISDAIASGAYVVSSRYPRCDLRYPKGASFVGRDEINKEVLRMIEHPDLERLATEGRGYVLKNRMAIHDMQMVIESLKGEIQ